MGIAMDGALWCEDNTEEAPEPLTVVGEVKWFQEGLGYGFILAGGIEYFVHYSQICMDGFRTLTPGARVSFTPCDGKRGPFAESVVRL